MAQQDQVEYVRVHFKGGTALVSRQDFDHGNWVAVDPVSPPAPPEAGPTEVDYVKVHFKGGWALAARAEVEAGRWTRIEDPIPTPKIIIVGSEPVHPPPSNPVEPPVADVAEDDGDETEVLPLPSQFGGEPVRRKRGRPPKVRVEG